MMASQPTLDQKVVELQRYIDTNQTPKNSRPKIQRVAEYLRKRENFEKHYTPRFVSIGPIHHGSTNLELGEKYKLMWAAEYIKNTGSIHKDLHKKIADNIDDLKGRFSDDVLTLTGKSLEGFGSLEEKLSWMLFVDGCFLLHILEKGKLYEPGHMNIVMMDVLLLENQLPYEVLKLLWKNSNESELIERMRSFCSHFRLMPDKSQSEKEKEREGGHSVSIQDESQLGIPNHLRLIPNKSQSEKEKEGEGHSVSIQDESQLEKEKEGEGEHSVSMLDESQLETPNHLLDLHRKIILTASNSKTKEKKWSQMLLQIIKKCIGKNSKTNVELIRKNSKTNVELITYRNIQDLKAVGIRFKSSNTQRPTDIDFSDGWFAAELTLPIAIVTDKSVPIFLNLTAYEMCPDFENSYEICSFVVFMESLIDHPEDVKELRSKGILLNCLGSDEEVANLFNIIRTDLVDNGEMYADVIYKIHEHYCNKYKTWIAQRFHTHFSNPWAITAFLAAFIALALTFIQTWFTVNPQANKGGLL